MKLFDSRPCSVTIERTSVGIIRFKEEALLYTIEQDVRWFICNQCIKCGCGRVVSKDKDIQLFS